MSELLSSVTGGGGGFITKYASPNISVASGSTGTFATLTPPQGQKVKLTGLVSAASSHTIGTTVTIGGVDVVNDEKLTSSDGVLIVDGMSVGYANPIQNYITGDVNEVIELKASGGALQTGVYYSYQFGE